LSRDVVNEESLDIVVVPHTHWDREWYLPLEGYRHRLIPMLDRVIDLLESGSLACFLLDGQCVVVEDYLQLKPERAEALGRLIRSGRLKIGPWYVLADEFLVSGEALLRNLAEGRRVAGALGGASEVAYSPDPFGHVSQIPQIVRGFGMDTFVFARGLAQTPTRTVYQWEGPDGSKVQALFLATSYSNGRLLLASEDVAERLRAEVERLRPHLAAPVVLVCAGSDHEIPHRQTGPTLAGAAQQLAPWRLHCGTLETYRDLLKDHNPTALSLRGELRGARLLPLLPGVMSARIPLKQANDRCQDLLELKAEPLSALACLLGSRDQSSSLRAAWRELLHNHAHDSICGCSIDAVHRENFTRFERVEQIANGVLDESAAYLARQAVKKLEGDHLRVLFNSFEQDFEGVVETVIQEPLAWSDSKLIQREPNNGCWIALGPSDTRGRVQVVADDIGEGCFPYPSASALRTTRLLVEARIPALGYKAIRLIKGDQAGSGLPAVAAGETDELVWMENEFCRVEATKCGKLALIHRRSGLRWEGLGLLESSADAGDTYNFSPLPDTKPILGLIGIKVSLVQKGPLRAAISVHGILKLPVGLSRDRRNRSRRMVARPVQMVVTLTVRNPLMEVQLQLANQAGDHRLRLRFPLRATAEQTWAQSAFDIVKREHAKVDPTGWIEDPATTHPQGGVCFVPEDSKGCRGLVFLARGLPEYELVSGPDPYLAVTLLRCVGWLSREDVPSRRCQAGPKIATPEAHCLGSQSFSFALAPWANEGEPMSPACLLRMSRRFAAPPWSIDANPPVGFGQESWPVASGLSDPRLAGAAGLLSIEGKSVVLSALFALDQNTLVLRLLQAEKKAGSARLRLHESLGSQWSATLADLEANPLGDSPLPLESEGWTVPLRPWGLTTLRLERGSSHEMNERPAEP
jgi:mannosylglycerate hydrolase